MDTRLAAIMKDISILSGANDSSTEFDKIVAKIEKAAKKGKRYCYYGNYSFEESIAIDRLNSHYDGPYRDIYCKNPKEEFVELHKQGFKLSSDFCNYAFYVYYRIRISW